MDKLKGLNTSLAVTAAACASTALLTYAICNLRSRDEEQSQRSETAAKRASERTVKDKSQVQEGKPKGTLLNDLSLQEIYLWEVEHLGAHFRSEFTGMNKMKNQSAYSEYTSEPSSPVAVSTGDGSDYNKLISNHEVIIADIKQKPAAGGGVNRTRAYVRAGPRKHLHFNPSGVTAAIVTCGGLCPGLNNVIRELTNTLIHLYGAKKVLGIRGGYAGFYTDAWQPIELTPEIVNNIHHEGGTFLGSSRGGFDIDKTVAFLKKHKINQLYVIGGDGTHRGAFRIHEECMKLKMNVGVCGIPKTIDNDVDHIDRSFGFSSAVQAAQSAIRTAKTEASCNLPNGIGIVKLMGRSAGFVAVHAAMSSGDVDLCLVPEIPIVLEGEKGCLPFLQRRVKEQGFAVVVVAEGAGEELLGESTETDASGNKKLPAIGEFLKSKINEFFKKNDPQGATVKYVDPSYIIRSCPANAADSLYCMQLAQNAVHGLMAGYTGFSVGLCNNRMVLLPIPYLVETSPRHMDAHGRTWERVLSITRQPNTAKPMKPGEVVSYAPMLR
mmetsp:Transcript_15253/g.28466  ORF Transcript_15253/g.28466 Transcript_15253/m.28466 type:complete len:551 (+) Transcript_15253:3-1655(+)